MRSVIAILIAAGIGAVAYAPAALAAADVQPPSVPTNVSVTGISPTQATVVWTASTDDVGVRGYEVFRASGSSTAFTPVGATSATSFTNTGLTSGIYRYRVRALDAAGNASAFSSEVVAAIPVVCSPTSPPPPPSQLQVFAATPTSVTLRWIIVVPSLGCSPVGYDILRAPGASGGTFAQIGQTGVADTFVDTTTTPSTQYRYQVRSRAANGVVSGPSNTVQVITPGVCTPSLPMGPIILMGATTTTVTMSWTGPTNPACFAYDVMRAPSSGGSFVVVGTTTGLSFTDTGLTAGTAYRYVVQGRIVPTGAPWGTTAVVFAVTQGCGIVPPPAPGNLTASGVTSTSVTLTWAVTGVPGCPFTYEILRAPGASGGTFTQVGAAGGNAFADTGLTPNTTYRYQMRTRDAAGNVSGLSNVVTVTTAPDTGGCAATYRIVSAWGGAFQGEVTVTNPGTNPIGGWSVGLTLSGGATITHVWNGRTSQTASPYTVTNESWNGALAPNATATFGFIADVTGSTGASGTVSCATA